MSDGEERRLVESAQAMIYIYEDQQSFQNIYEVCRFRIILQRNLLKL